MIAADLARLIDTRISDVERAGVRYRHGVVAGLNPLTVKLGGSDVAVQATRLSHVGDLQVDDIVSVLSFDADLLVVGQIGARKVFTALPAGPYDGQRITFQTAGMASAGVRWELEYNAGSGSSYKWEYVGGGPLYTSVGSGGGPASITSATWSNAPTTQCDVTLPLAGDYEIVGQTILNPAVSGLAIVGVAIGVGGSPPVTLQATNNVTGGGYWSGAINGLATALASGTVLRMRYWHQSTGNITVLGTNLMVRPIRVG